MKRAKPFTYMPAPDVRKLLEEHKKKTGATFVATLDLATREYLNKKSKKNITLN